MAKRIIAVSLFLALTVSLCLPVSAEHGISFVQGEEWFPDQENWTYKLEYSYPALDTGSDDVAAMMVNESLQTVIQEMVDLVLPMFSHSEEMTADGPVIIRQTWEVTANTDRIFSVLMTKREIRGEEEFVTLEGTTFDVGGEYAGEMLTLRGLVRVGESSVQLGEALMPVLWEEYLHLVSQGIVTEVLDEADFYETVMPTMDFYADGEENAVFFFQPSLFSEAYTGPHTITLTPGQLEALAENVPVEE